MKEGRKLTTKGQLAIILVFSFVFAPIFGLIYSTPAYAGVPMLLSFQGRLTNASGSLLGSSGTNYYFKFDIYPSLTGGSSLWSSGATAITIKVTQGVFNTLLGDTSAGYDVLNLDFDSPTYYLEVQVSSIIDSGFETLSPRQRIAAAGFAINAETVHGGRFINATGVGQFGGLATVAYSRFGTAETTLHAGTINSADDLLVSGGLEIIGSAAFDGFVTFGSNASISGTFNIIKAMSSAQLNIRQDDTYSAGFYVDSMGNLTLSTTSGNIKASDQNLWVCIGSCDLEASPPAGDGNIIMENSFIFDDNSFRFQQSTASTSMYDSLGNEILQFDEAGGP